MKKAIGLLIMCTFLVTCQKELLIEVPDSESKLVVESYLRTFQFNSNNKFEFYLRSSSNINDTTRYGYVEDATILLYKNNILFDTLEMDSSKRFYKYDFNLANSPKAGDKFRVEVSHPDFQSVSATTTMPSPITIGDTIITPLYSQSSSGDKCKVDITFKDPPEENFYEIFVTDISMIEELVRATTTFPSIVREAYYPKPYDLLNGNAPNSLLFSDKEFNGEEVTIDVIYQIFGEIVDDVYTQKVVLRHISKEQYEFKTKVLEHLKSKQDDILYGVAEPLAVPSFVNNGYGIFAAYNETIIDVIFSL